jgi:hypothetical protein
MGERSYLNNDVVMQLRARIARDTYRPDGRLPSLAELMAPVRRLNTLLASKPTNGASLNRPYVNHTACRGRRSLATTLPGVS